MPRGISTQVLGGFKTGMDRQTKRGGRDGAQRLYTLENAYLNERGDAVPRPGLQHVANVAHSSGLYGWQGQLHVFHGESDFVDPGNPLVSGHWVRYPYVVQPLVLSGAFPALRFGDSGTFQYTESGGVLPYGALGISAGALPPWASMNASGLVTYNVNVTGTWSWTVSGQDADNSTATLADTTTVASEILATWKTSYTGAAQVIKSMAVANGIIFVGNGSSTLSAYSTNAGSTFTLVDAKLGARTVINCIKFNGSWYAFSDIGAGSVATGDAFVFAAMANAQKSVQNTATIFTSATYPTGALYMAADIGSANSAILRMNTPGAAWTTIDTGLAYGLIVAMCQAGGKYFFATDSGKIIQSTDLVVFTLAYNTLDISLAQCAYLALSGVLVVTTQGGDVYRTADLGATWSKITSLDIRYITATRQEFLATRTYDVKKSTDGITWVTVYSDSIHGQQTSGFATDGTIAAVGGIGGYVDVGSP